ncbi:MAG: 50S ribosomal protein L6 [Candidatus Nomurabacteria bacterium]|jgi:large subunit ribosomal protein L6|nr:50S ribosomal protein L6 [Candidatus Nomurabacteria bacterium]
MSRIGKLPVKIPAGVTITVDPDWITVRGAKGELKQFTLPEVDVKVDGENCVVSRHNDSKLAKSQHGLMRALIQNMVIGVSQGFEKKLTVTGVGFRVASQGSQDLEMQLGFSHPVKYQAPDGVTISTNKMEITVSGIDKQKVGQVAAEIRALKKPEPYKGKGIAYKGEVILRKSGKAGK